MFDKNGSYMIFAFTTEKGTFTLSGSNVDGIDTFREVGTNNFHDWHRSKVREWYNSGKIHPVKEATSMIWY